MRGWRPPTIAVDSALALVLTVLYLPGATDAEPAWVVIPLALAQTLPLALRRVRPVGVLAVDSAPPPLSMTAATWSGSCGPVAEHGWPGTPCERLANASQTSTRG